uniref:Uncharacterized protein n=1 Tax=Arion vulgaris TaxID=1028688 RepID=A0A0B7BLE1_9EUPU
MVRISNCELRSAHTQRCSVHFQYGLRKCQNQITYCTEDRTCQPKLVWIPSNGNELFMYYTVYDYVEKSYARYATVDNASFLEATHLSLCLDY